VGPVKIRVKNFNFITYYEKSKIYGKSDYFFDNLPSRQSGTDKKTSENPALAQQNWTKFLVYCDVASRPALAG
jgi:hypothetical protein